MAEANRLQYNLRGKVEAAPGQHDDMCIATSLALMGLDQVNDHEDSIVAQYKPANLREVLDWERLTGKKWKDHNDTDFAPDSGEMMLQAIYR